MFQFRNFNLAGKLGAARVKKDVRIDFLHPKTRIWKTSFMIRINSSFVTLSIGNHEDIIILASTTNNPLTGICYIQLLFARIHSHLSTSFIFSICILTHTLPDYKPESYLDSSGYVQFVANCVFCCCISMHKCRIIYRQNTVILADKQTNLSTPQYNSFCPL